MSIVWCNKPYISIVSDIEPKTIVRKRFPSDEAWEIADKKKFPYINKRAVLWTVSFEGETYSFIVEKNFKWDGTTCLFLHHIPSLLDASCLHDKLCNKHYLVGNNRKLASIIFREIGIASGTWKWFMWLAYFLVDLYQKYFGKDLKNNKWNEY